MKQYDLCGLWRFQPDPHSDGESLGFYETGYDYHLWREASVPSCFDTCLPELQQYGGICWYRLIELPEIEVPEDSRLLLRFAAVNNRAKIWVNGTLAGEHRDPFLPFEFDITDIAGSKPLESIVVMADNTHHFGDVPGMHTGWHQAGGITREVELAVVSSYRISDVSIAADHLGAISVSVNINDDSGARREGTLRADVRDRGGSLVASLGCAAADEEAPIILPGEVEDPLVWAPESPELYTLEVVLFDGAGEIDRAEQRFGFRSIATMGHSLLLNGEPVFLTGFNRHEDSPDLGMSYDAECTRRDLEVMKKNGANAIRLCHYPHHPSELDLCDEIGLLVFCEVPLYFWNDEREGLASNEERISSARRQLVSMIARDRNHPSVIIWSVSNETNEQHEEVAAGNRELIRFARKLDPSRLAVHVSNHWIDHPNFADDDLICINYYPSIDWKNRGRMPGGDLAGSTSAWLDGLRGLSGGFPGKPILVTEFGYCSIPGTDGNAFGEDEHARVLEGEFAAISGAKSVCGALIWCWADHPWPGGRFLDGMITSPFGVVSRSRRVLKPLQAAGRMFRQKHDLPVPPKPGQPNGTSVALIRPRLDDIPEVALPEGYELRPMSMAEPEIWIDIQRDSEQLFPIADDLFYSQFGDDPAAVSRRCFILRNEKGLGIGTISAWYDRDFRGEEWGLIHWVAVRPSYQGRGLSNGMLSAALQVLSRWHDKAYLNTDTRRVAAIGLYLKFGFLPDMSLANARTAWGDYQKANNHPAVRKALLDSD